MYYLSPPSSPISWYKHNYLSWLSSHYFSSAFSPRGARGSSPPTSSTPSPASCPPSRSSAGTGWPWWGTWWGSTSSATRRSWGWPPRWWRTTSRGEECCWRTMTGTGAWRWLPGEGWRGVSQAFQVREGVPFKTYTMIHDIWTTELTENGVWRMKSLIGKVLINNWILFNI